MNSARRWNQENRVALPCAMLLIFGSGCTQDLGSVTESGAHVQYETLVGVGTPATELRLEDEWFRLDFTGPGTVSGGDTDPLLDDVLVELIETAEVTLDLALYDFDRANVVDAVLAAFDRGVELRVVGDEDESDAEGFVSLESAGVPVVYRPTSSRIMHNKFVVVDESVVWTGSTNVSDTGMEQNNNNAIILADEGIAAAYTAEFEQMSIDTSFGRSKDDVLSGHEFDVAGVEMELYFSPQDDPEQIIIDAIESADHSIRFMVFSFTHDDIAQALVDASERGVDVAGIMDTSQASSRYAVDEDLAMQGIPVFLDGNENSSGWAGGKLHHKVLIVDQGTLSDPLIITGSMNWSGVGSTDNDENILVVHDDDLATTYGEEFCLLYESATISMAFVGEFSDPCTELEPEPTLELADADLFVNEVLVVDDSGESAGSFIEFLHTSDEAVDLDGAVLEGNGGVLVEFAPYRVEPGASIVLCGQDAPSNLPCDVVMDAVLDLEWGGEHLSLYAADGQLVDELFLPPAAPGSSLNRSPDGDFLAPLVRHEDVSPMGLSSSPGTRVDGSDW